MMDFDEWNDRLRSRKDRGVFSSQPDLPHAPYTDEEIDAAMRTRRVNVVTFGVLGTLLSLGGMAILFCENWRIGIGVFCLVWGGNILGLVKK